MFPISVCVTPVVHAYIACFQGSNHYWAGIYFCIQLVILKRGARGMAAGASIKISNLILIAKLFLILSSKSHTYIVDQPMLSEQTMT